MARSSEPARDTVPGDARGSAPPSSAGALLSASDVARVVDRMAHQLIEKAGDSLAALVLIGIPTRGAPLARRLAARVEAFSGTPIDVGTVDITLYRDDLRLRGVRALEPTVLPDAGIDGRLVVLVDDVLYSGRSASRASSSVVSSTSSASSRLRSAAERRWRFIGWPPQRARVTLRPGRRSRRT
jgi:pyrimidine operon attenuation protein/uracil phosphoribosyltransferase